MNIREIQVNNFRSLRNAKLSCDRLTAIVGRNGTGKSSFLRALELFYDQSAMATPDDFYNGDVDQDISITVTFSDLTPDAHRLFAAYLDNDTLSVARVFSGKKGKNNGKYYGTRLRNKEFDFVRKAGGLRDITAAYRELQADQSGKYGSLPPVTRGRDALAALDDWESENPQSCRPALDQGQFFGFTSVGKGRLGKYTTFIRIPAVRDALSDATETRGSCITQLMDRVVRGTLASRADVRRFKEDVKAQYETIFDFSNLEELQGLESQLTETLAKYAPNAGITLDWSQLDGPQIQMPSAQVKLSEDGYESAVDRAGHGLQRAFILTVLQHLVATQVTDPSEKASEESGAGHVRCRRRRSSQSRPRHRRTRVVPTSQPSAPHVVGVIRIGNWCRPRCRKADSSNLHDTRAPLRRARSGRSHKAPQKAESPTGASADHGGSGHESGSGRGGTLAHLGSKWRKVHG